MKTKARNITLLVLGLLLAGLPAIAATWNRDTHAGWWGGGWISYNTGGGSVSVPSGATVAWYAYAYSNSSAFARVIASGPGVSIDESVNANGSNSGSQTTTAAGTVIVSLETGASGSDGGTGCGVTVSW